MKFRINVPLTIESSTVQAREICLACGTSNKWVGDNSIEMCTHVCIAGRFFLAVVSGSALCVPLRLGVPP